MQGGLKRYNRKDARPVRSASSSSAWSHAMFSAAERADGQMERWNDGREGSPSLSPSFQLSVAASVRGERIRLHGRAHAHQVPVAVRPVHPAHRRPHLVLAGPDCRERGPLARVRAVPGIGDHVLERVGRAGEQIVAAGLLPRLDLTDLLADRDERVTKPVELLLRFALRRLDHERARDGKRDRRRMEPVVDDALGDVLDLDPGRMLERSGVDDALVGDAAVRPAVQHGIMRREPLRHVVSVEDSDLGGLDESLPPHERDVRPGDRKGARWGATQIGPIPGPPPPCGMQNVLWRLRWHTSAPMSAGRHRPTWAFMLAPSMYTCPPWAWTISQICRIDASKTPVVDG